MIKTCRTINYLKSMGHILEYKGHLPQIGKNVFIAPNATVIGKVEIGDGASIWFGAVVRGDTGHIKIGAKTNIQDNAVVHVNRRNDTFIGDRVTIGHGAVVEGCVIEDDVLIGMNATVLDGAIIGAKSIIAAGSVVREGGEIPPESLAAGVPAKVKRVIDGVLLERVLMAADEYVAHAETYMSQDPSSIGGPVTND